MSLIGWETLLNKVLLVMRLFFSRKVVFFVRVINSLLNSKFLNWQKPKAFADNNMFLLGWKENIVEKGVRLFFSHNVFKWFFLMVINSLPNSEIVDWLKM